jgi:mannitol/fructose-specific phosphotransferase system IIA component (Ntr-type)
VKILMDLNLFKSDIGMLVVASAILRDIVGWNIFAVILSLAGGANSGPGIGATIGLTVLFVGFMLSVGRWLIDRILPWVQAHATWPAGVLGLALVGGLACAAFTEWLGIHAIFGAFIFGVALGDSSHLRQHTRTMMEQFVGFIFAPIFFASIGLRVNFLTDFDPWMTLVVIVIGTVGMVGGSMYAARWAGYGKKEAAAIGVSLNARGVMVIILGIIALQTDPPIIRNSLFVALVVMELINTASSGFLIQVFIRRPKKVSFRDYISGRTFVASLAATNRREAIVELSQAVCRGTDLKPSVVAEAVWQREIQMSTGLDHGMAVPHARITGLKQPLVAIGISSAGIDFDTRDGLPTHLVFLILTPLDHHQSQLEILADIGRTFQSQALVDRCTRVSGYTEFLAEIKSDTSGENGHGNGH